MATKKVVEETVIVEDDVLSAEEKVEFTLATGQQTKKLVHPDGRVAYVHESMIPAYQSGGFKEEE